MNACIKTLREKSISSRPEIFPERAVLLTESYKETEGEPMAIRRAKALKKVLEEIPIIIHDGELIIGEKTLKPRGSHIYPELYCPDYEALCQIENRVEAPFYCSDETKGIILKKVYPYWRNKQAWSRIREVMTKEWKSALEEYVFTEYMISRSPGHINVDGRVLNRGFRDIKREIEEALSEIDYSDPDCYERICELKAMDICIDAAIMFANRYAALAMDMAKNEENLERKKELEKISKICKWVPENPARSFHEALQSYLFIHLIMTLETNEWASCGPGRFDQYIYPFYRKDIDEGKITKEEAKELLECLWIKFNNAVAPAKDIETAKSSATYNDFALMNIGGLTEDGRDATNELSYLLLDVIKEMRLMQPNPAVLISQKTPDRFLLKACDVVRAGFGQPSIFNVDLIIDELVRAGKTLKDARLGGPNGCVTVMANGKENGASYGYMNWPKILELVLYNGVNPVTGRRIGLKTGDPTRFRSFDELLEAYKKQMEYFVDIKIKGSNVIDRIHARYVPTPFASTLVDDCVKRGKDYGSGGARYNRSHIQGVGLGTTTDSLAVIKKFVFDEKTITMSELIEALTKSFKGEERLRQMLLNRAIKYGNDDDYVDEIARKVVDIYCELVEGKPNARGGEYGVNLLPTTAHIPLGAQCGATPDGRKAGEPLSEGISPVQGRDLRGPASVIKSVSKIDHVRTDGTLLNQKFNPSALAGEENLRKFSKYVRTYFALSGHHIQFNVISADILKDAQKHPENYRDLIVRVAGYSDYFVTLNRELQNEIIARTEHLTI